jgi:two-component system nitrate/nitrite sensor histidine kinase NarQ
MEERATIARELHDSLAQVLSYLRIQLTLLKRAVPEENPGANHHHRLLPRAEQCLASAARAAYHLPPDA